MSRPDYVSDVHRLLGPGVAEAMQDPKHLRVAGFQCVDYGPEWDEVPRVTARAPRLTVRPSRWQRLKGRLLCRA